MDVAIVTVVCLLGLATAAVMSWNWRHLDRRPSEPMPEGVAAAKRTLRSLAITVNSALIAGILVGGLGGRLLMRIMAASSGDGVQGTFTDAEERVGEITFGGTVALIVFGGIFAGVASAAIYRFVRRWLPARPWLAGVMLGVLALGAGGRATKMLHPDNHDFDILAPTWLAVALVIALALGFGVAFVTVYERLDRAMPEVRPSVSLLAFAPLLLACLSLPVGVTVIAATLISTRAASVVDWWSSEKVTRFGRNVTRALVVVAGAVALRDAVVILG